MLLLPIVILHSLCKTLPAVGTMYDNVSACPGVTYSRHNTALHRLFGLLYMCITSIMSVYTII